jgi:hypothetical protein
MNYGARVSQRHLLVCGTCSRFDVSLVLVDTSCELQTMYCRWHQHIRHAIDEYIAREICLVNIVRAERMHLYLWPCRSADVWDD